MAFNPPDSATAREWLDGIFQEAFERGASDIFIDAMYDEDGEIISISPELRIDGWNIKEPTLEGDRASQVIVMIKNDSEMGTSALNEPQEGRFPFEWKGSALAPVDKVEALDVRVTIFPIVGGEFISMRIPPSGSLPNLEDLGLSQYNYDRLMQLLSRPQGLIELAGPMGSGKTTTMYSVMKIIGGDRKSVVTVEDPKERTLDGARQMVINPRGGMTYAAVLKSLLRVVMDAMLIGEIRDQDTASAAVKFSTSGTKVLSSIHSGDPVSAIARTIDLSGAGVIAAMEAINGIMSQRLIRTLHAECKGQGCPVCDGSGVKGRMPVHEVLINSPEITEAMLRGASRGEVHKIAREQGMISFHEDADRLLESGQATRKQIEESIGFDTRQLGMPAVIDLAPSAADARAQQAQPSARRELTPEQQAAQRAAQEAASRGEIMIPEEVRGVQAAAPVPSTPAPTMPPPAPGSAVMPSSPRPPAVAPSPPAPQQQRPPAQRQQAPQQPARLQPPGPVVPQQKQGTPPAAPKPAVQPASQANIGQPGLNWIPEEK